MKPRIFISSTYYDLKHVRERIERFIDNYKLEPVLFESDNVTFEHNKPLDTSCYNEVKQCHMMILIIGGRYGSIATGENIEDKKEAYNRDFVSITRKEYETALATNIPTFIFIEKNVYAEYLTFKKNLSFFKDDIEIKKNQFSFAHVDDINVFRFINNIKGKAIKTFEKVDDIENYIANQLAGMLFLYLQNLQDTKKEEKVLDSVSELKRISEQMNEMIQAVGKNVIQDNSFNEVIESQNKILVDFYVNQFIDNISFTTEIQDFSMDSTIQLYGIIKDTILNNKLLEEVSNEKDYLMRREKSKNIETEFNNRLSEIDKDLVLNSYNFYKASNNYFKRIHPILSKDENLEKLFEQKMATELQMKVSGLPF